MSEKSDQKPKPLMTFVFDEVTVLTLKAESNLQAKIQPPPSANAPLLTLEADEMTEFVLKAIPAKDRAGPSGKSSPVRLLLHQAKRIGVRSNLILYSNTVMSWATLTAYLSFSSIWCATTTPETFLPAARCFFTHPM